MLEGGCFVYIVWQTEHKLTEDKYHTGDVKPEAAALKT